MKNFISAFSLALLVTSPLVQAEQYVVRGSHYDMDYEFAMSDEYEDVHGSWGESRYDLVWDSYNGTLEGRTAGEPQLLAIDASFGRIELTTYCGWGDLEYSSVAPWRVHGTLCLEPVDQSFESFDEAQDWMKTELLRRLLSEFPEPARAPVQTFVSGLLRFE
jgi:hypothetical protein